MRRYFALADEVASLERDEIAGNTTAQVSLAEKRREQQRLENKVESILEERLTRVLEEQGLTTSLPVFSSVRFVFPPADFEFDRPPAALAVSPREEIRLEEREILLRSGLSDQDVSSLEAKTEATGVSSLVVNIHAVAFYPRRSPQTALTSPRSTPSPTSGSTSTSSFTRSAAATSATTRPAP